MRSVYESELKKLNEEILAMGNLVKTALIKTLCALKNSDKKLAQEVINEDASVDELDKEIEGLCLKLFLMQQPVASDMRTVSSALKMITDFERMGDFAVDIAEIVVYSKNKEEYEEIDFLLEMGNDVVEMVDGALRAFVERNVSLAKSVCLADDKVDELFVGTKERLLSKICVNKDFADRALDLMVISKYLERIGDHATNVAEWAIFFVTGQRLNTENGF